MATVSNGFILTRMRIPQKAIAGYWEDHIFPCPHGLVDARCGRCL